MRILSLLLASLINFLLINEAISDGGIKIDKDIIMTLEVGQKAPEFKLEIQDNKFLTLDDFKGKYLVLYFYPKDNTPGCTIEANDFNKLLKKFHDANTEVIGISKDSLYSHDKFKAKHDLKFNLASDADLSVSNTFGAYGKQSILGVKYMGVSRATFLINPEGRISAIWPDVSVKNHAKKVLEFVEELEE